MNGKRNEHLEALAHRFVQEVRGSDAFDDVYAWAITGSVARGEATEGSDLELWALVPRARQTRYSVFENEPVTIFFESTTLLDDFTYLVTVEAEHLRIIDDPDEEFQRVRNSAQDLLPRFVRFSKKQTQRTLLQHEDAQLTVREGTLAALKLHRKKTEALVLWAALHRGVRRHPAPKHYHALFGEGTATLIHQAMALQLKASLLDGEVKKNWPTITKYYADEPATLPFPLRHTSMQKKLDAGDGAGALVAARTFLSRHFHQVPTELLDFELLVATSNEHFCRSYSEAQKTDALHQSCSETAKYNDLLFERVR